MMAEIEPKFRAQMNALAAALDETLNGEATGRDKTTGFVLLVFPFNWPEGQRANYISNADRRDMLVALKEIVARFEGQADVKGRA
jgi:hypothetical protein